MNSKSSSGLNPRVVGQEVNKTPVTPIPRLNQKLQPKRKDKAPNVK